MTRPSLRVRLTFLTAALLCLALVAGAVALGQVLTTGRVGALDEIVRDRATQVAALVHDDRLPDPLPVDEPGEVAQVLDADGRVVASSSNASRTLPVIPASEVAAVRARGSQGVALASSTVSAYDPEARVAVLDVTDAAGNPRTVVATMPLTEVRGLLRALQFSLLGIVPVLTVGVALGVWFVLGRALGPVDQLRRAAAEVAETGGPGSLPVPPVDDEIAALARTLNAMLDRLDAMAVRQRAFVADAAHELRSPLSSLRATVEVAADPRSGYTGPELAQDLHAEVLRMQGLVDDLLLLARLGSAPGARRDVDLAEVAREGVAASGGPARDGLVAVEPVRGAGRAHGDPAALARVVRNLVENARRHAAGTVRVEVAPGRVDVEDDGRGIAPQDRERVFERFVRLDEARERGTGGSGLGLAIAREVAREHGGDVVLGGAELGGLRASLVLPVAGGADAGQPGGPDDDEEEHP